MSIQHRCMETHVHGTPACMLRTYANVLSQSYFTKHDELCHTIYLGIAGLVHSRSGSDDVL